MKLIYKLFYVVVAPVRIRIKRLRYPKAASQDFWIQLLFGQVWIVRAPKS